MAGFRLRRRSPVAEPDRSPGDPFHDGPGASCPRSAGKHSPPSRRLLGQKAGPWLPDAKRKGDIPMYDGKSFPASAFLLAAALFLTSGGAAADGVLIPRPPPGDAHLDPFGVKVHRVHVAIDNQAARTVIDQVFTNPNGRVVEGTYLFPIPESVTISE
ncbi:MAG: hypothetical protein GF355_15480, partial [Candidatus Eisenbacteria bacterium]|nr:hypothetical protein [Candidatus Eisenbacteria bacterium]